MEDEENSRVTRFKPLQGTLGSLFGKTYEAERDAPVRVPEGWISPKKKTIVHKAPIMITPKPKHIVLPPAMPAPKQQGEHVFETMEETNETGLKGVTLVSIGGRSNG